ncbi:hypothetical protein H0H93_005432, partial [Arthromyces matolae]
MAGENDGELMQEGGFEREDVDVEVMLRDVGDDDSHEGVSGIETERPDVEGPEMSGDVLGPGPPTVDDDDDDDDAATE